MEIRYCIADFTLGLWQAESGPWVLVREPFDRFIAQHDPDISLSVLKGFPELGLAHKIFDSGQRWSLWHDRTGRKILYVKSFGLDPACVLILPVADDGGRLYVAPQGDYFGRPIFPLDFPLSEVCAIDWLAQHNGTVMHATAIKDGDRGYLFVGFSGAGKTTTATLWASTVPDAIPLSDDRIVLRKREGHFRIYGTPWWGVGHFASPESVPLTGVFILRHAEENTLRQLRPREAVSQLLVRTFAPLWDAAGMAATLDLFHELSETVPCFEFGFKPDASAVECIRSHRWT